MFAEPPALTWDGENRLIRVGPTAGTGVPEGAKKAEYAYDYLGRRVQKKVWTYTGGSWSGPVERRYVWSGWLLLMELEDCGTGFQPVRKYTWGLDLAGQNSAAVSEREAQASAFLERAGGIGGLLAVSDPNDPNDPNDPCGNFVYFYDGNGNVGQVVDLAHDANDPAGAIVAKYEYDPYGQRINHDPNVPEYDQPWRFSTKQFDAETGLGYWGYRYYSPGLGRWISRDPLRELGSTLLAGADFAIARDAPERGIFTVGWGARRNTGDMIALGVDDDAPSYQYVGNSAIASCDAFGLSWRSWPFRDDCCCPCASRLAGVANNPIVQKAADCGQYRCTYCFNNPRKRAGFWNAETGCIEINCAALDPAKMLVHEAVHAAMTCCGRPDTGHQGEEGPCARCLAEEMYAYSIAGQCNDARTCFNLAKSSCLSIRSCDPGEPDKLRRWFNIWYAQHHGNAKDDVLNCGYPHLPPRGRRPPRPR